MLSQRCWYRVVTTAIFLVAPGGCSTVPVAARSGSGPLAESILRQCADATGSMALKNAGDVSVHLVGHWSPFIGKVQPVLVDDHFRRASDECYLLDPPVTAQLYHGPGGEKFVRREPAGIHVWYNGAPAIDKDVLDAAALVADGYRLFLLGPAMLIERHAAVRYMQRESVNNHECDDLLATLTPGIGRSSQDRIVVSIDRGTHEIVRYRITVNGMQSTQGAVADIFCMDYIRFDGVAVPTRFYEELKVPFDISVHHWRLTRIDLGRHLSPADLTGPTFRQPAT